MVPPGGDEAATVPEVPKATHGRPNFTFSLQSVHALQQVQSGGVSLTVSGAD